MNGTINKVILIGNVGEDIKTHYFDEKNCIGRFSVATSEYYTNKEGERVTQTEWHTVVVRNILCEVCEKHVTKGSKVYVEGKLKTRKWDSHGTIRYTTEVICDKIEFLKKKEKGDSEIEFDTEESSDIPF